MEDMAIIILERSRTHAPAKLIGCTGPATTDVQHLTTVSKSRQLWLPAPPQSNKALLFGWPALRSTNQPQHRQKVLHRYVQSLTQHPLQDLLQKLQRQANRSSLSSAAQMTSWNQLWTPRDGLTMYQKQLWYLFVQRALPIWRAHARTTCQQCKETIHAEFDHFAWECPVAQSVWARVFKAWSAEKHPPHRTQIHLLFARHPPQLDHRLWRTCRIQGLTSRQIQQSWLATWRLSTTVLVVALWHNRNRQVWDQRNDACYGQHTIVIHQLVNQLLALSSCRPTTPAAGSLRLLQQVLLLRPPHRTVHARF